jgi:hypothetical protein
LLDRQKVQIEPETRLKALAQPIGSMLTALVDMARSPENVLVIVGAVLLDLSALGIAVIRSFV